MGYVLALPEAMCDILLKCLIHILKAHDISSWKIQEKVEIITNYLLQFWTKIPKNRYCDTQQKRKQWFLCKKRITPISCQKLEKELTLSDI